MASNNEEHKCRKIELIEGLPGRKNTVISGGVSSKERDSHVVYFPGDVQSFEQEMSLHRVGKKWVQWSLENTTRILQKRFPTAWIWIVIPHRFHEFVFSCFDNFVECNVVGSPVEFEYRDTMEHLQLLLHEACTSLENILNTSGQVECDLHACDANDKSVNENKNILVNPYLPVKLIGFSKGCVVLNQIVFEMKKAEESKTELKNFVKQISAIYWLDGGHTGEENTWVTDRDILQVLAKTGICIHAHVTPYQVDDVARPWIAEEHRTFLAILKELEVDVTEKFHFEMEERSLKIHFKLLEQF